MHRHELTDDMARTRLAGFVRNHCAGGGTNVIFSVWNGLDLTIRGGIVYRVVNQQPTVALLSVQEILDGMSDEDIERAVLQGGETHG